MIQDIIACEHRLYQTLVVQQKRKRYILANYYQVIQDGWSLDQLYENQEEQQSQAMELLDKVREFENTQS